MGVVAACGGSPATDGRVSGAGTPSAQTCTTSTEAPLPLSALQYDARPNPPVNLLQNGDVEAGSGGAPAAWHVDAAPAGSTLTWDPTRALSGTHALLVTTTAPGRAAWAQDVSAVEAGLRYRLRANIFASTAGTGTHALEIFWIDGAGTQVGHDALQSSQAGQWAEVDGFVTAPAAAAKATVAVAALAPGQYSFDDVMLVTAEPDPIAIAGGFPLGLWSEPFSGVVINADFRFQGAPGQPLAWFRSLASGEASLGWSQDGRDNSPGTLDIQAGSTCDASWIQNVDVNPQRQYQLVASLSVTNGAPGSHAVEVSWRDASGAEIAAIRLAAQATGGWSDVSSAPLQPPSGAATARVAFRVFQPGVYHARWIRLIAAPGTEPIFDPRAVGIGFSGGYNFAPTTLPHSDLIPHQVGGTVDGATARAMAASGSTVIWFAGDEIAWQPPQVSPAVTIADYQGVKALGGLVAQLPVWINQAPRGPRSDPWNYALLQAYSPGVDVISIDIYPVPALGHSALPNEGPWAVGEYTDIARQTLATWGGAQRKVVWMVLQAFDWGVFKMGGDHVLSVTWRDTAGQALRTDSVASDRANVARDVFADGLAPPPGAADAVVKAGAYWPAPYSFSNVTFGPQRGPNLLGADGSVDFPVGASSGDVVIGSTPVQGGARYTLRGRILAQRLPTEQETRFMAWDAIIHGARGLSWYGMDYVVEGDTILAEVAQVTSELHGLSDDLMAPASLRAIRVSDPALEARLLAGPSGMLLAVANRTRTEVSGTIGIGGPPVSSVQRVGESCEVPSSVGNTVADHFGPLAVHLYRIH